ncbi:PPE domain-containing protein [Nocardia sp. CDC160]|uniref:PPE domain-containing protein n=1 Tax=Nocardia sp. CDC160 TaxID=3112166 RepID=UPI002DB6430D|nr:PPE domain-containing protein [Nocardia sp. CDC160]MEC3920200.1 PPE domain-containing protein [Nocardia sp. CDC160]
MATLNVDPQRLAEVAVGLADLARETTLAMYSGWVVPAGADPISATIVPDLNQQTSALRNSLFAVLADTHRTAFGAGASAADYRATDGEGARIINGGNGDLLSNPVGPPQRSAEIEPPAFRFPSLAGAIDPLVFAQQLHSGPGPGPAIEFAGAVRNFLAGPHDAATSGIDNAMAVLQDWTPVGASAVAELGRHRGRLDQLGSDLADLIDAIETYGQAFATAKANHPTPQEIIATRQQLLAAMRSKNEFAAQDALAKFQEQQSRSAQTIGQYTTTVNTKNPPKAPQSSGGGSDLSSFEQMLPLLMSAMNTNTGGLAALNPNSDQSADNPNDYLPADYIDPSGPSPSDIGGSYDNTPIADPGSLPAADPAQSVEVGPLPMIAPVGAPNAALPSAAVIEPLSTTTTAAAAGRSASGSPYMPYMPMTPGMGTQGASGGDRARVVAWHPDRLMYVDDTPHTEAVIGEKPTIAPLATPATPMSSQSPTTPGGSS